MSYHSPFQKRNHHFLRAQLALSHLCHERHGGHFRDGEFSVSEETVCTGDIQYIFLVRGWQFVFWEEPLLREGVVEDVLGFASLELPGLERHVRCLSCRP